MALSTRFSSTCFRRSGSPLKRRWPASAGRAGRCAAPGPSRRRGGRSAAPGCPARVQREVGTDSSVRRSASILERSRTSLISPSRCCDAWSALPSWSRSTGSVARQRQAGHAHDGAHRRAQFVAHVGQEAALGAVGGFGRFLGDRQRGGAFLDQVLQVVRWRASSASACLRVVMSCTMPTTRVAAPPASRSQTRPRSCTHRKSPLRLRSRYSAS
jgi:hypothetical protein